METQSSGSKHPVRGIWELWEHWERWEQVPVVSVGRRWPPTHRPYQVVPAVATAVGGGSIIWQPRIGRYRQLAPSHARLSDDPFTKHHCPPPKHRVYTMPRTVLHLRSEQKPLEHRSCLTPSTTKALIDSGHYEVHIEKSPESPDRKRVFGDDEFPIGPHCTLVEDGSWPDAPADNIIVGLKELPEEPAFPLKHTHVQFAHCYKGQAGWDKVLARFVKGGGVLYDLEFLEVNKRRVAAFGYHAGFAGSALAVKTWAWQLTHPKSEPLPGVEAYTEGRGYYDNEDQMLEQLREELKEGHKKAGRHPRVLITGALVRISPAFVLEQLLIRLPGPLWSWGDGPIQEDRRARREHHQVGHHGQEHARGRRAIQGDCRVGYLRQQHLPEGSDPTIRRHEEPSIAGP